MPAVLILLLLLLAVAPAASAGPVERAAVKQAGAAARAAGAEPKLPLPRPLARPAAAARTQARLAGVDEPARLLVGVSDHRHMDAIAGLLERQGERVRRLDSIGVVAVTADSPAALVARLRDDSRVAFVERNERRRMSQEPSDDVDPNTGIPFGWAFDEVRAGPAIDAVGGASQRGVAVIDTGLDAGHPDLADNVAATFNVFDGSSDTTDVVGHGTFVTGLIAMVAGNGLGGKGVAGRTPVLGIKAGTDEGTFSVEALVLSIEAAIQARARIINMSLGGESFTEAEMRALDLAFFEDVLPVAAGGNEAQRGNATAFPAALVGGENGAPGIGLAVAATKPDDSPADFSNHGFYISLAAPGEGQSGLCPHGVFSSIPRNQTVDWDGPNSCNTTFGSAGSDGRWAYGPGTSFAAPIAAGVSAIVWQAELRLQSQQVAEVMMRGARQSLSPPGSWNEFTGTGIVDAVAAIEIARVYDVLAPSGLRLRVRRRGRRVRVTARGADERTEPGDELAGGLQHLLFVSVNGSQPLVFKRGGERRARRRFRLRDDVRYRFIGAACDANGNCAIRRGRRLRG